MRAKGGKSKILALLLTGALARPALADPGYPMQLVEKTRIPSPRRTMTERWVHDSKTAIRETMESGEKKVLQGLEGVRTFAKDPQTGPSTVVVTGTSGVFHVFFRKLERLALTETLAYERVGPAAVRRPIEASYFARGLGRGGKWITGILAIAGASTLATTQIPTSADFKETKQFHSLLILFGIEKNSARAGQLLENLEDGTPFAEILEKYGAPKYSPRYSDVYVEVAKDLIRQIRAYPVTTVQERKPTLIPEISPEPSMLEIVAAEIDGAYIDTRRAGKEQAFPVATGGTLSVILALGFRRVEIEAGRRIFPEGDLITGVRTTQRTLRLQQRLGRLGKFFFGALAISSAGTLVVAELPSSEDICMLPAFGELLGRLGIKRSSPRSDELCHAIIGGVDMDEILSVYAPFGLAQENKKVVVELTQNLKRHPVFAIRDRDPVPRRQLATQGR